MRARSLLALLLVACTETEKAKPAPPAPPPSTTATVTVPLTSPPIPSAPPSARPAVVHGDCTLSPAKSSPPLKDADRVFATMRPKLRDVYEHALGINPAIEGTIRYGAYVAPDGTMASFVAKAPELPPRLVEELAEVMKQAKLDPPGKVVEVRGTIVCARSPNDGGS